MKVEFKDRLLEAMELRGLRAVDLIDKTGIPKVTVSYYMSGKSEPRTDKLHLIAKALNVSEAWLLGYDVEMERTVEQKKTDLLAALVGRMKKDADFLDAVAALDSLTESKYQSIKQLLDTLSE